MTVVVDASLWVSSLLPGDAFHHASWEWLQQKTAEGEPLIAPAIMLAEVGGAISRRTSRPDLGRKAVVSLLRLRGLRLVAVDRQLGMEAARIAAQAGLRGADAVYAALARRLSVSLTTWDDELQQRAGHWVVVQRPTGGTP